MRPFTIIIFSIVFLASACAHAAETDKNLINSNPFLPTGWKPKAKPTYTLGNKTKHKLQIDLRGIMQINGVRQFSLFDRKNNSRFWAVIGENIEDTYNAYKLLKYDSKTRTLTLLSNGQTIEVPFKKTDGKSIPVAGTTPKKQTSVTAAKKKPSPPPRTPAATVQGRRRVIPAPRK